MLYKNIVNNCPMRKVLLNNVFSSVVYENYVFKTNQFIILYKYLVKYNVGSCY